MLKNNKKSKKLKEKKDEKNNSAILLRFRFKIKTERIDENLQFLRNKKIQAHKTLFYQFKNITLMASMLFLQFKLTNSRKIAQKVPHM